MRTTWLAGVIGAVLLMIGAVAAAWVGPDDWVDSPAQLLNPGGEAAVVTNYGLWSYALPLRVTAAASDGEVFIGIGHAIDVEDYVATTSTSQVAWFSPQGLVAEPRSAVNQALPAAPAGLDFWRAKASGPGVQSVAGRFAGQPLEAFVATPSGESKPLHISIGTQAPGAFAVSVAAAAIGVMLLLFAGYRWRRRRSPGSAPAPASDVAGDESAPAQRAVAALALGLAVSLAISGCSAAQVGVGMMPVPPRAELTRDPLDGLDLTAVAADYDRRNNPAIAAAKAPRYSDHEWSQADGELILGSDRFITAWDRVEKVKDKPYVCRTRLGVAYPGIAPRAYPLEIVVSEGMSCGAEPDAVPSSFVAFTRVHSYAPWIQVASVSTGKLAPPPAGVGDPTAAESSVMEDAANQVAQYLSGHEVSLTMPAKLARWRDNARKPTSWRTRRWVAALQPGGLRIGRDDTGVIGLVSILITVTTTAKPGSWVGWKHPWDQIYGQTGSYRQTSSQIGLVVAVKVSAGQASILSWSGRNFIGS
jgi:hypothetical protein